MGFEPTSTLFTNKLSTIWPNWSNDWAVLWVLICTAHLTVIYYYVMYAFQSESTLYSCLNIKEVLTQNRHNIWRLSESNGIRTHLVQKWTLNHLAKLVKSLRVVLWVLICTMHLIVCYYHVMYMFQSESTLCCHWSMQPSGSQLLVSNSFCFVLK